MIRDSIRGGVCTLLFVTGLFTFFHLSFGLVAISFQESAVAGGTLVASRLLLPSPSPPTNVLVVIGCEPSKSWKSTRLVLAFCGLWLLLRAEKLLEGRVVLRSNVLEIIIDDDDGKSVFVRHFFHRFDGYISLLFPVVVGFLGQ